MPRGDNLKGPFLELGKSTLAFVPCPVCSASGVKRYAPLRVNGHGRLFVNCDSATRCGQRRAAYSIQSARAFIRSAVRWQGGKKKRAYEIAGIADELAAKPEPKTSPDAQTQVTAPDHHETPETESSGPRVPWMRRRRG